MRHAIFLLLICAGAQAEQPFVRAMPYGEYDLYISEDRVQGDRIAIKPANWYGPGEHPQALMVKPDESTPRALFENGRICVKANGRAPCAGDGQKVEINFGHGTLGWLQVSETKERILIGDRGVDTPHSSIRLQRPAETSRKPASK
jgi:hypothetical protein